MVSHTLSLSILSSHADILARRSGPSPPGNVEQSSPCLPVPAPVPARRLAPRRSVAADTSPRAAPRAGIPSEQEPAQSCRDFVVSPQLLQQRLRQRPYCSSPLLKSTATRGSSTLPAGRRGCAARPRTAPRMPCARCLRRVILVGGGEHTFPIAVERCVTGEEPITTRSSLGYELRCCLHCALLPQVA